MSYIFNPNVEREIDGGYKAYEFQISQTFSSSYIQI